MVLYKVFVALSEGSVFSYKVDNYYNPVQEQGIAYNDPQLAIDWQLPKHERRYIKIRK
jgi:dTDP-4-dehydrorhamnose 3,5-epimerase